MARATLTGVTRMKTSAMQRGLRNMRRSVQNFKRDVAAPFALAATNLQRIATQAALVTGIVAGMGVKQVFNFEAMETQFEMLFRNTKKAKDHVKFLADLSAVTPFDVEPFVQASRLLQTMGGEALNNKKFITQLGDAASIYGQDIERAAEWTGRLFNDLKAGIGTGRGGRMLMITGMIKPKDLLRMQQLNKEGASMAEKWAVLTSSFERAKGGMERMSKTGLGLFSTLRGLIKLAAVQTWKAFGDQIKNITYGMNTWLQTMRNNGTFTQWGANIARVSGSVINSIWRIVKAWQNLNANTRSQLLNMAAVGGVAVLAFKSGVVGPMITAAFGMTSIILTNFKKIGIGLALVATAMAGYKLGNVLGDMVGSNTMTKIAVSLKNLIGLFWVGFRAIVTAAMQAGDNIWLALTGRSDQIRFGVLDTFKSQIDEYTAKTRKEMNDLKKQQAIEEKSNSKAGKGKTFKEAWDKEFSKDSFAKMFKLPPALQKFMDEWKKTAKTKITFPDMPKPKPLDESLQTGKAIAGIEKMKRSMSKLPLRGIYASLGKLKAAANAGTVLAGAKSPLSDQMNRTLDKALEKIPEGNRVAKTQRQQMINHLERIGSQSAPTAAVWA